MSQAPNPKAELAADYYLQNFKLVLQRVEINYADLLTAEEQSFIQGFYQLPPSAQCLLVRMLTRKGIYFRSDKLNYLEVGCTPTAAGNLIARGFVSADPIVTLEQLTHLLTKPELLGTLAALLPNKKNLAKGELVEILVQQNPAPRHWLVWTQMQLGDLYQVEIQPLVDRLMILFFGNGYQDLSEFVLQDLGIYEYETYSLDKKHRVFSTRADLEYFCHSLALKDAQELACTPQEIMALAQLIPAGEFNARIKRRFDKLRNSLAYKLERSEYLEQALELYQLSQLPPARERCVRILEKQNCLAQAWELLQALLTKPANQSELQAGQVIAKRLHKKLNLPAPITTKFTVKELNIQLTPTNDTVEQIACTYFHKPDAPCVYVENTLFNGLFGLWLWPVMFASVDAAFAHEFHAAPLDMYQEDFVARRPQLQLLWQELETGEHRQRMRQTYRTKWGKINHWVNWEWLTADLVELALVCISAPRLKAIFSRLLFDLKENRSGFPDLIQFYPEQQNFRLIEIKGPGDRLQDNQKRWLEYFAQQQIEAEVCYVNWC